MTQETHILLVDDDEFSLLTLEALLSIRGYRISLCDSGREALSFLEKEIPDAILLDLMMPEMNGIEVCRHIRKNPKTAEIPVIMVTAIDDRELRLESIQAGTDDFLQKPYDRLELEARVRSITNLNRLRRQRQEELRQERDRNQAILNAVGEGVIVTNSAGTAEFANPAASQLTGYPPEELIGQNNVIWQYTNLSATSVNMIKERLSAGNSWRGELVYQRKDKSYYHAALTIAPIHNPQEPNHASGSVAVFRDITTLKEAQRLKEEFVSNVSHELRTPLSVLTLLSGNLENQYERLPDEKRKKIIHNIREQAKVLKELVDSVLQLMVLDNANQQLNTVTLDLGETVTQEVHKHMPLAEVKNQEMSVSTDGNLLIEINEAHLRQVIRNFISNAIKYTPANGSIQVSCRHFQPNSHVDNDLPNFVPLPATNWAMLIVQDNGIGINEEQLPHIFGRFYRAHAGIAEPGAGLGLSIAKQLVERYNGHISLTSNEGEGSIFAIYFPLTPLSL